MKQQINPAVAAVVVILILAVAGFFLWKGAKGDVGTKATGEAGNQSPFSPGGALTGKGMGAKPAEAGKNTKNGPPGMR